MSDRENNDINLNLNLETVHTSATERQRSVTHSLRSESRQGSNDEQTIQPEIIRPNVENCKLNIGYHTNTPTRYVQVHIRENEITNTNASQESTASTTTQTGERNRQIESRRTAETPIPIVPRDNITKVPSDAPRREQPVITRPDVKTNNSLIQTKKVLVIKERLVRLSIIYQG